MNERSRMYEIDWITAFRLWVIDLLRASALENLLKALFIAFLSSLLFGEVGFYAILAGLAFLGCQKVKKTWLVCENHRTGGRCGSLVDRREKYCGGCGTEIHPELRLTKTPREIWPPGSDTNP